MTPVAVAGLLTVLLSLLDASNSKWVGSSGPDLWWVASSPDLPSGWVASSPDLPSGWVASSPDLPSGWVASSPELPSPDLPSEWVALVVLLTHLAALSPPAVILKEGHYVLFYLTPAIQPRMLVTYDEDLSPLLVNVRVGQVRNKLIKLLASNDNGLLTGVYNIDQVCGGKRF